jgi:hypothetical protein
MGSEQMGKWNDWYESLPAHTKAYLKTQPVWHDRDVAKFVSIALAVGFFFGYIYK